MVQTQVAQLPTAAPQPTYTPLPTYTAFPTFTAEPTGTELPRPTATKEATFTPAPSRAPQSSSGPAPTSALEIDNPNDPVPAGKWQVQAYKTDDLAAVFVNRHMVGVASYGHDLPWLTINDQLRHGHDTIVAFAAYDAGAPGAWGFGIRNDDTAVWGNEGTTGASNTLAYTQQVAIRVDGTVEALPQDAAARKPPPGKWMIRAQGIQDIGAVLVNGQPVAVYGNGEAPWVDIGQFLYSDRDNQVTFSAWNDEGPYAWDFAVSKNGVIVWGKQNAGAGMTGLVFEENVTISPEGTLLQSLPTGTIEQSTWQVRAYRIDDLAAIFVNRRLVGVGWYGTETGWITINDQFVKGEDAVVALASYDAGAPGAWGFTIRRDDTVVWGTEGNTGAPNTLAYGQQVLIKADGSVQLLPPEAAQQPPPGKWYIRAQRIQDVGAVLVNGQPVTVRANGDADWVDITGLLYQGRDNQITFGAWNVEGPYGWDFALKKDDNIVWAVSNAGGGKTGLILDQSVTITRDGKVK
jgi:hypothetical protein